MFLLSFLPDICTPSAFSSLLPTSKGFENGPAPTAFNMMQQNPPPIPFRKSKPSEYRSGKESALLPIFSWSSFTALSYYLFTNANVSFKLAINCVPSDMLNRWRIFPISFCILTAGINGYQNTQTVAASNWMPLLVCCQFYTQLFNF